MKISTSRRFWQLLLVHFQRLTVGVSPPMRTREFEAEEPRTYKTGPRYSCSRLRIDILV